MALKQDASPNDSKTAALIAKSISMANQQAAHPLMGGVFGALNMA